MIGHVSFFDYQYWSGFGFSQVTITVQQLPDLVSGENYECVFHYEDSHSLSSQAEKSGDDLSCMTPDTDMLPIILEGSGKKNKTYIVNI